MTTRARIESELKKVQKRVREEAARRKKQIAGLRARAADAALGWVMSHESRVSAFRSSVKGTPVAKVVDTLLDKLKSSAPKSAARKPAKKKSAARKPAAKKAAKKKTAAKRKR
jgi:hypothetical protein